MDSETTQPDLTRGVSLDELAEGIPLAGRVGKNSVILVRSNGGVFAVGARCTHYHGHLADGVVEGDRIHCPCHHASFSLRTGEALQAPALDPIGRWRVLVQDSKAYVQDRLPAPAVQRLAEPGLPKSIVIIGGGAAGVAAAAMLRREGYEGDVTMLSAESELPSDRPNLSKDFLDGSAPADWVALRPEAFYERNAIRLLLGTPAVAIDPGARQVVLASGRSLSFDALLIATGAEPVHLDIPGGASRICYLRSFADSQAIIDRAARSKSVVVLGTSFIGLEVAAALRRRGLEVHVVGRDATPLAKVLGVEVGRFVQSLHEANGVTFHFGTTVAAINGSRVVLENGTDIEADFVVLGVGVRPSIALAESAGLSMDRGILVSKYLETSAPGIYAAGDIARWPDPHSGERIRVEHWVVAQRQGQVAARNMLGKRSVFDAVPFFWSQHYDVTIKYTGHAERWDRVEIDGSLQERNCAIRYILSGKTLALATIGRDRESLVFEMPDAKRDGQALHETEGVTS